MKTSVTAIIPTHNRDDLLADAVSSFAEQSLAVEQVIVVDDADSQWTPEKLIKHVGREDFQVTMHKNPKQGASGSRNLGAEHAVGDYLCFLDDDDIVHETYVQEMVACLQEGFDVAVCWTESNTGDAISFRKRTSVNQTELDDFDRLSGVTGSNFVIRRDAFEEVGGFDAELYCYNDKDFFLRLIQKGYRVGVVEKPLVTMRQHNGSRLTTVNRKRIAGLHAFLQKHEGKMSKQRKFRFETKILLNQYFIEPTLLLALRLVFRSLVERSLRHHLYLMRKRSNGKA